MVKNRDICATILAALFFALVGGSIAASDLFAASATANVLKAKQEAESKGYAFFTSRDEIINRAKKEAKVRALTGAGLEASLPPTLEVFKKKYPFIDAQAKEVGGTEGSQRFLLEVKAGANKEWDIARTATDAYSDWLPHVWKVDILGMAEQGILDIPVQMIDPKNRNVVALASRFSVVVYNKNLVAPAQVPKTWEDMLKPEFKGKKFAADIHPTEVAGLVPGWGLEKTLDYARKIAAQEPIWFRASAARPLAALGAGEIPILLFGANYGSAVRAQRKDPLGVIQWTTLEPVPVRITVEEAILSTSKNPHAALLWLEFMASAEAQALIDQHEPLVASVHRKGSAVEQALRGKKLSVVSWDDHQKSQQWIGKIAEAYGFPRAEMK
jgi:ABC-type Fe3+ transport system substrate-binding protein